MSKNIARKKLIHHIKSVNKFLTDEWIEEQTDYVLLACAHPMYRKEHAKELGYGEWAY